ncbi:MAG: DUF4041 domain-containing protein [Microcoleus sp. SU_5_3]|nr:DUF4041 domain-containing protein [Microcoleus sp. SU_5_3]
MLSTPLLLTIAALVSVSIISLGIKLIQMRHQRNSLRQALRNYESLTSREETEKQLDANIQLKLNELQELDVQQEAIRTSIKNLQSKLRELEAKEYLISIDDYEPKYAFVESKDYLQRLEQIQKKQKTMRDNNQAFIVPKKISVGERQEADNKGEDIKKDIIKLIKFAFEKQCKYALKKVRYDNLDQLKKEINTSFNEINKCFRKIECRISEEYLNLKFIELDLKYELEDKKKEEKDRQQEVDRQNREIEKKEKIDRKVKEVESREKLHQQELDKLRQEMEQTTQAEIEKRKQLEFQIQDFEEKIAQDRMDKETAKKGNSGHIYIISNIGSLREPDVYRICMTNRKNPDEYIRDLNPAVPFRFDVHYKIHSENVFDTLEELHKRFNDKRLNKVNSRRDFFKVPLYEIDEAVKEIYRETGILRIEEIKQVPQAYEYRQTVAARKKINI